MQNAQLVAIAETDEKLRQACSLKAPTAEIFNNYTDLLQSCKLDAVVICLPPALHAVAALASLENGLHVYIEKPLATTLDDGKRVVKAWKRAETVGHMGFNFRFHPLVLKLRQAIEDGLAGEIVAVRMSFSSAGRNLPAWKRQRATGGGALLDLGSHQFDIVRFVLGQEIVEVQCLENSKVSEEDTASVQLRMSDDTLVSVFISISAIEQHRVEILGTRNELVLDRYRSSNLAVHAAKREFSKSSRLRKATDTFIRIPAKLRDALFPPTEGSFAAALESFVSAIGGNQSSNQARHAPDLVSGLRSLAVVIAAEESARTGTTVRITQHEN